FFSSRRRHTRWPRDWRFRRVLFRSPRRPEELHHLRLAQDRRQLLARLLTQDSLQRERTPQGHAIEKHQGAAHLVIRPRRGLLLRSEERRVGKECRSRCVQSDEKKKW